MLNKMRACWCQLNKTSSFVLDEKIFIYLKKKKSNFSIPFKVTDQTFLKWWKEKNDDIKHTWRGPENWNVGSFECSFTCIFNGSYKYSKRTWCIRIKATQMWTIESMCKANKKSGSNKSLSHEHTHTHTQTELHFGSKKSTLKKRLGMVKKIEDIAQQKRNARCIYVAHLLAYVMWFYYFSLVRHIVL